MPEEIIHPIKKFTIDRKFWLRGKGPAASRLLTDSGCRCCMGFFAESIGAKPHEIKDVCYVYPFKEGTVSGPNGYRAPKEYDWLSEENIKGLGRFWNSLSSINDDTKTADLEKETTIDGIFKDHGIEVEFIN